MVARRVFPALFALTITALAQQPLTISGSAAYRERMALPANAIFVVTLEDASHTDAKAVIINQFQKESPGSPPFEFKITYDPEKIIESHTYVVRAKVTVDDRLLFTSTEREQVLTQGHGSEISTPMMMRRVSSPKNTGTAKPAATQETSPDVPLRETYWKLVELNGKPRYRHRTSTRSSSHLSHEGQPRLWLWRMQSTDGRLHGRRQRDPLQRSRQYDDGLS